MAVDVDTLRGDDDLHAAGALFRAAMVGLPPLPPHRDHLSEPGRTLGVRIDGRLVGTAESYTSWLVVPGGARVPHAAVTHVGVLPTHTRRGVLTALLRRQLDDIAERGEVVATLRASEGSIYERFGYGVASSFARLDLRRGRARLRDTVPPSGPVRFVEPADAWKLFPQIYASAAISWTGAIDRPDYWWKLKERTAAEPVYTVAHGPLGAEDGFARYHPVDTANWFTSRERTIVVDDLVATTPQAYLGLIRHLLAVDLVDKVTFAFAPVDAPLRHLFTDERAVEVAAVHDETWLRLVDVPTALSRRTYRDGPPVIIEVDDPIRTANTGRYRICADKITRVDDPADVSVDVATLGAIYLGGSTWRQLAFAGRVVEHRAGAVDAADNLFATPTLPFSGTFF
ncbi:GNAT family N-acetyltransferase [Nocardia sp. XZ_19_231]|uniref:GNAT family N-acetyltransferase n=1 Tax=Nocardia sp. XZ_19_231 TaxID=2769252 RepID=UPI00188FFE2E|nr:GNAT family N-acetyltransferase [Nocardia sp. XZ_19_231]